MSRIDVRDYGAVGDGVTDDRLGIQAALDFAVKFGHTLFFSGGRYKISAYIHVFGARNMTIAGEGATIVYESDKMPALTDSIATLASQATSALFLRYCTNVVIDGLCFEGGDSTNIETVNRGSGVYLRHCTGVTLRRCSQRAGHSLIQGNDTADTSGVGSTLSAGPIVTWIDSQQRFVPGHAGHRVTIAGCEKAANNGVFVIESVISSTEAAFTNPAGEAETSGFRWSIDDGDRDTRIEGGRSDGARGSCTTGSHSVYQGHHFEWPTNADVCGIGDSLTVAGTTVTLTDTGGQGGGRFLLRHHGKFIVIRGASGGHDGIFQVSYISASQVSWTHSGVETKPFQGDWWILGGEKTGRGAFLSQAGVLQTITLPAPAFSPADVGKMIRLAGSALPQNNTGAIIVSIALPTTAIAHQPSGANESFKGVWTINAYDNGQDTAGDTHGSSHAIYIFGGRQNIIVDSCTFIGNRTCCVKISGSHEPLRDIAVSNCFAEECASFVIAGADDANEHTGISVENNRLIDCSVQRAGWDAGGCISFLGSRNVKVSNNQFHWTRNSILSQWHGQGSVAGISASRYVGGRSQPVEDVLVSGNTFTSDPSAANSSSIIHAAISISGVGIRAKYATAGSLTFAAPWVTLKDNDALFSQAEVGCQIWRFTPSGQMEGSFVISQVSSDGKELVYANASGAPGPAGTYRIQAAHTGGACIITGNRILWVGAVGINCARNVGPDVTGNVFAGLTSNIRFNGDVSPRAVDNRSIADNTQKATIALSLGTSWPFIDDNLITNGMMGASAGRDMGISVVGAARVDYPLLGKRGRVRPSDAREEVVVAFGSQHVDGDTIRIKVSAVEVAYTFKAISPSSAARQFNSFDGLVVLINDPTNPAGVECADYGAAFAAPVPTYHLRIRRKAATAGTDGTLQVSTAALNPTALVIPCNQNQTDPPPRCLGRGSATQGAAQADRTVIWSLACAWAGGVIIWADNEQARSLLHSYGWGPLKDSNDAGACEVIIHGPSGTGPEFRWVIA